MIAIKYLIQNIILIITTFLTDINDTVLLAPFVFFVIISIVRTFKLMVNS